MQYLVPYFSLLLFCAFNREGEMVGIGMSDVFCVCCCFTELFKTISFPYFQFDPSSTNEEERRRNQQARLCDGLENCLLKRKKLFHPVFLLFLLNFKLIDVSIDRAYLIRVTYTGLFRSYK